VTCTHCNTPISSGERFCGSCGRPLTGTIVMEDPSPSAFKKQITVGASSTCDIAIDAPSVSGEHLRVSKAAQLGRYLLEDLGSTNGTFVDGERIQKKEVGHGSIIQLGLHRMPLSQLTQGLGQHAATPTVLDTTIFVGRLPVCDIVLPFPMVSGQHLEVRLLSDLLEVRDLGSSNGTFIARQRLPIKAWTALGENELHLGSFRVPPATLAAWREALTATPTMVRSKKAHATIPHTGQVLIGRDPSCDVVIAAPQISWQHARVTVDGDRWIIEDLNSSNGVFVNGSQIKKGTIQSNDQVFLGSIQINLDKGKIAAPKQHQGEIRLDAVNLTRQLDSGQIILDQVGVSIYPGELVALMGPSGAGKTTLLEMLTGQQRPNRGQVLINGADLHDNLGGFGERIGYVPQEDIMHRDLTVFEVLFHSAMLRLPSDLPQQAVVEHVETLLVRMGIDHIRDSVIGGEAVRGISGGQRKRVNIAIELITEPPLLFLDEPTSGLDSTSTLEVMTVLRALADTGKTIIATVHQPRIEAFECFDQLLLLTKGGKLAFYGPANPDASEYFAKKSTLPQREGANPADYVIDVLDPLESTHQRSPESWQKDYAESEYQKNFVVNRRGDSKDIALIPPKEVAAARRRGSAQFNNLLTRYKHRKIRDKSSLLIQIFQPILIGGLIGLLFTGDSVTDPTGSANIALFLLSTTAFWLGCSNVARELVADRPVYKRERRAGLSASAYLNSVFTLQLAMTALQTLILVGLSWPWLDVQGGLFLNVWGVLLCTAAAGVAVGMLISAAASTEVTAISLVPILLLPQLMFSGFLLRFADMSGAQQAVTNLVPLRWSFEAIARMEYNASFAENGGSSALKDAIGFPEASVMVGPAFLLFWTGICLLLCLSRLRKTPR
jgi:ABC-type multidrug transport system ATPase subunit